MTDLVTIKERQQQMWSTGDYMLVSGDIVLVSEWLCEAVDLRANQRVLDVATGTGNTALAAARRRCEVIGVDYVPTMIETAQARAATERLHVTFRPGDAENLPFADVSFDVVLSTFGMMFTPDQDKAVSELLRAQGVELSQQFVKEFVFNRENIDIFSSEASRCEAIIFPILREVYKDYCHQYSLWIQKSLSY